MIRIKSRMVGIAGLISVSAIGIFMAVGVESAPEEAFRSSDFSGLALGNAAMFRPENAAAADVDVSGQSSINRGVAEARCQYSWSVNSAQRPDAGMLEAELRKQRGIRLKKTVKHESGLATDYRTEKGGKGTASFHVEKSGDHWNVRCAVAESLEPR